MIPAIANLFIIQTKEQMEIMGLKCDEEKSWRLPRKWSSFWKDLIHVIQECSMMSNLMLAMADGVLTTIDPFLKGIFILICEIFLVQFAAWLSYLIQKLKSTGTLF